MKNVISDIGIISKEEKVDETVVISKGKNNGNSKKLYVESYGCQMNFSDSEIVTSIMEQEGFDTTSDAKEADLILINTCSIRDRAEQTVRKRLNHFNGLKKHKPEVTV